MLNDLTLNIVLPRNLLLDCVVVVVSPDGLLFVVAKWCRRMWLDTWFRGENSGYIFETHITLRYGRMR